MKTANMTTMAAVVVVAVVMMVGMVEGTWRQRSHRFRDCQRAAGQGMMEEGSGNRFQWTMSGLDEDNVMVTYQEEAFAPQGSDVIFKSPRDQGQRMLGLVPAKLVYDFSTPDQPVVAIRETQEGRGTCVVLTSDVSSYGEMMTLINVTNRDVINAEDAERRVVEITSDLSQFSEVLRGICSQDLCGSPVITTYYIEVSATRTEEETELQEADDSQAMWDPSFMLMNSRVVISGMPNPRDQRRRVGSIGSRAQRRQEIFQRRRQNRRDRRRQNRRG